MDGLVSLMTLIADYLCHSEEEVVAKVKEMGLGFTCRLPDAYQYPIEFLSTFRTQRWLHPMDLKAVEILDLTERRDGQKNAVRRLRTPVRELWRAPAMAGPSAAMPGRARRYRDRLLRPA